MKKIKSLIIKIKWLPFALYNQFVMKLRRIETGGEFLCFGPLFIRGTGTIKMGNKVRINSCRETNPIGGDTRTILFAKGNSSILIGNHVGISNTAIVALKSIEIEDDVMIGAGCKIYDHDFHSVHYEERMLPGDVGVVSKPVKIKKGAFIGAHTIVLKGVTIGEKSVVGAGSVVTKSIPDHEIWAGNPAKFIRKIDASIYEKEEKYENSLV